MAVNPSKSLHFDSWENLLQWLPEAEEAQLMTVFVWSGDLRSASSDGTWLARIHKETFERLVARTSDRLKQFLVQRVHCRDADLAEDVVQQVLVKLYLRAEQYDPRRSFWGWLYRIARNETIDALRRLRPGDRGVGGQAEGEFEEWLANVSRPGGGPDDVLLDRERRQLLDAAIDELPELQRTVVRLKAEGMKGKAIAQKLGISQAYVSQLYHEAGEILRDAVGA
jgi:RNA polymerase sigma-70 factor (ECF subfamily)